MPNSTIQPKSIKLNYMITLAYEAFSLLVSLVTVPYVSRVFTPQEIGVYSFSETIAQYFIIFGNLGIATYGQIVIAKRRDDVAEMSKAFAELWALRLCTMLLSFGVFMLAAFNGGRYRTALLIQGLLVFGAAFDLTWLFRGIENFSLVVTRNIVVKVLIVSLVFLLVKKREDIYLYIFLMAVSTLIGNLTFLIPLRRVVRPVDLKSLDIVQHLRPCMVFFIPTIATSIYLMLDKAMLGLMTVGSEQNGYYEQAHRIEQVTIVVITSLNLIMRSRMSYLYERRDWEKFRYLFRRSVNFIMMLSIPMALGMIAVAPQLIPVYLGAGYEPSIPLLRIFSTLLVIIGLSNCLNTHILSPSGRQGKNNYVLISGAVLNVICNALWIPRYGAIGASCASVLAELLILTGYLVLARDFITPATLLLWGWRYIVSGALMTLALMGVDRIGLSTLSALLIKILCGGAVYFTAVFALRDPFAAEGLNILIKKLKLRKEKR